MFLIKEVKGIEHGTGTKMSGYKLTLAICLTECLKATQMWFTVYSDLNETVNEGLLVPPADDMSLEILPELYFIIS